MLTVVKGFVAREYRPSDHDEVIALHRLALKEAGAWFDRRGPWESDMDRIEETYMRTGTFLVGTVRARDGMHKRRRIVSIGGLWKHPDYEFGVAEIRRMRTHPDYQHRGYGQVLLSSLEYKAAELGYERIILSTSIVQTPAQEFYKKNGYVELLRKRISEPAFETVAIYYQKTFTEDMLNIRNMRRPD